MSNLVTSPNFRSGSIASFWQRRSDFRFRPEGRHPHQASACLKGATFGLMRCGKSTLLDHLVGMGGKCCASAISMSRRRRNSSTKPPPAAAPRDPARRQSAERRRCICREATAVLRQVTLPGSERLLRTGNWNSGGRGTPYGVTHTHFAIVSHSALVSKSRRCCKQNIRLAVESFLEF